MKITSIFKVAGLCAVLTLASCGGDSGTTAPTTTSGTSAGTTTVTPNTGTVTVNTAPNNVVSIGASGTIAKVADATGKAVFTGLTPGAVDVHVFSADGYSATSYMGINTTSITDTTLGGFAGSVIDVYVQVVNPDISGQDFYLLVGSDRYFSAQNTITGIVSFYVNDKVGSAVTGTVYAAQGLATSSAGNAAGGRAEVLNLGTQSFTTTAASGAAQVNLVANFSAVLPAAPALATLQSVTPPAGMSVTDANFGYATVVGAPLTLPDTIGAGMIGNDWSVQARVGNNVWSYQGVFTQGATLTATATLATPPTMTANQTGNTLSWTNNSTTQSLNIVDIYDAGLTYDWTVFTPNSVGSVTLPTVPAGVTAPLTAGMAYSVDVVAVKEAAGASYEQIMAFFAAGGQFTGEFILVFGVPYTR